MGWRLLLQMHRFTKHWSGIVHPPKTVSIWDTGVPAETLKFVGAKSCSVPEGFVSSQLINHFICSGTRRDSAGNKRTLNKTYHAG